MQSYGGLWRFRDQKQGTDCWADVLKNGDGSTVGLTTATRQDGFRSGRRGRVQHIAMQVFCVLTRTLKAINAERVADGGAGDDM